MEALPELHMKCILVKRIGEEADTAEAEDTKAKSKKKTGEKEAEEVNV